MSDLRNRIRQRSVVAGVELSEAHLDQLAEDYDLLERWNSKINLTALPLSGYPDAAVDRVIVEPLITKTALQGSSEVWFDIGSGGGSPAIPIKIIAPDTMLTMVESKSRKCAFLREAVRVLGLTGASVWTGRFEELPGAAGRGVADLLTMRAVRVSDVVLAAAADLLRYGARFAIFGAAAPPETAGSPFIHISSEALPSNGGALHWLRRTQGEGRGCVPRGT